MSYNCIDTCLAVDEYEKYTMIVYDSWVECEVQLHDSLFKMSSLYIISATKQCLSFGVVKRRGEI
jgi:hypothetical protein